MIYETKGLTLEQVDELYEEVSDARKWIGWVPTITFREIREEKKVRDPVVDITEEAA